MAKQIKKKVKGITYVYEQTSHYDPEKKRSVYKQVLIGKLDEATGEIVPTRKKQIITKTTTTILEASDIKKEIIEKIVEPLKEKDLEKYKEAVELVEKIPETPKKSEQTSSALGLYTANPLSVMFNGKATGALGQLKSAGDINPQRKTADVKGVKIISQNITEMGVGEAKIFRYALAAFTQKNSTGTSNSKLNLRMFLSFKDYAEATNTDISNEYNLKNFKKKLKKNLENLMEKHISFSWTENVRGKSRAYGGLSLISGYKIDNEAITVDFSLGFAEYLASLPTLVEYPRALYSVNDRNFNAFAIGEPCSCTIQSTTTSSRELNKCSVFRNSLKSRPFRHMKKQKLSGSAGNFSSKSNSRKHLTIFTNADS